MLHKTPGRNIGEASVERLVNETAEKHGSLLCLDVGSGNDENNALKQAGLIQTLDNREEFNPDYLGDIRPLFVPGYPVQNANDNESLSGIRKNTYMLVKLQHVVEHIEWIYQERLMEWAMNILAPGGLVYIGTPNLEFAIGVYVRNRKRQLRNKGVKYPIDEHPYCKPGIPSDMQKWVNFKIFSGCSPGDYHHCMYDRYMLYAELMKAGFENISIFDGSVLKCVAYKPGILNHNVGEAIVRATE